MKKNCWEHFGCGREPGGDKVGELGVCPATTWGNGTAINGGQKSGRICWAVTGTYCKSEVQGSFAKKIVDCAACDFYRVVRKEEGKDFVIY